MEKKYCRAGQATDDNMAHAHFMLDTWGYKHTLSEYVILIAFLLQGDSFGTRPKKMRISQRLFCNIFTYKYIYNFINIKYIYKILN
jgi:hypothetical protein